MNIIYSISDCSLGCILIAQSDLSIVCVMLADKAEELTIELRKRFKHANIILDQALLADTIKKVIASIESNKTDTNVMLDLQGTAFQQKVWRAIQAIPAGRTATYKEIARRIDLPTSARAVAQACAANKIAVIIPCHRVIRSDGGLSGYRWGVTRKKMLLEREASLA